MVEAGNLLRWIYGRILGHPMNFSFIDERVSGAACPMSSKEIEWLQKEKGIGAILSLTESPLDEKFQIGFKYKNVPMKNHAAPTIDQLRESVDFILDQSSSGRKVAVHCAAGEGRTGTVLAAYLCKKYGITGEEAVQQVRMKRKGSIEKNLQEKAVVSFCELERSR